MGNALRDLLGITTLDRRIDRLEKKMATAKEQLQELAGAFSDFVADVNAKLDQLVAAQGTLDPEAQTILDELKAAVADADAKVGDADGCGSTGPSPPCGCCWQSPESSGGPSRSSSSSRPVCTRTWRAN